MRHLELIEIEYASGGSERRLPTVPVTGRRRHRAMTSELGLRRINTVGITGDDVVRRLEPVLVVGEEPDASSPFPFQAYDNINGAATAIFDDAGFLVTYFNQDGFFDANKNGIEDEGEVTMDSGNSSETESNAYAEAVQQFMEQNPDRDYNGADYMLGGALYSDTYQDFIDTFTPRPQGGIV